MSKIRIYISSTYEDLKEYREAVHRALRADLGSEFEIVCMEDYVAQDERPLTKCLEDVRSCVIYLGIFAMRYGFVPTAGNPEGKSITELEYREACKRKDSTGIGTQKLLFLSSDTDFALGPRDIEHDSAKYGRLLNLRAELGDGHMAALFRNKDHLASEAVKAVRALVARNGGVARLQEMQADLAESRPVQFASEQRISLDRLPDTSGEVFGREQEIAQLDEAWEKPHANVFCLIGFGGMGKSAIVKEWVARIATRAYAGANRVFAWSFYSQERDQQEVSADLFFSEAFRFFGVPVNEVLLDPIEKGAKLAQVVRDQRNLLILDGLEALQFPGDGKLKDQAIVLLLKKLMETNRGMCVVTSRSAIPEAKSWLRSTVVQLELGPLPVEAGVELLEAGGVHGAKEEIAAAVREYRGHPLLLELLGGFLKVVHFGDVTQRHVLDVSDEPALRLMKAHQQLLGEGPELDLLRVLGLFNRPARLDAIDAVIAAPAIAGLTDHLTGVSRTVRNRAILQLRELRLLSGETNERDFLETHAVVREHFSNLLLHENREAWREANSRLFNFYRGLPIAEQPDSLDEMAALFQAVVHGCRAGCYQETWKDVEWKRVRRGDEGFSVVSLGAWSADLVALSSFFERPWDRPMAVLDKSSQAWLLTETAFDLRGLGRLDEAITPLRAGLSLHIELEDWWAACDAAGNLSEQLILYADLKGANSAVAESVRLALQAAGIGSLHEAREIAQPGIDDAAMRAIKTLATNLATQAEVFHHRGDVENAYRAYQDSEQLYTQVAPGTTYLHKARGFHYCELLLDLGRYDEVIERSTVNEAIDANNNLTYAVGLAKIVRAKAMALRGNGTDLEFSAILDLVNNGVETLRRAGQQELLLRGLLAAATLHCAARDFPRAEAFVQEVEERTGEGRIPLLAIDSQLVFAQLKVASGDLHAAVKYCDIAEQKLEQLKKLKKCEYGRRKPELAALRKKLES